MVVDGSLARLLGSSLMALAAAMISALADGSSSQVSRFYNPAYARIDDVAIACWFDTDRYAFKCKPSRDATTLQPSADDIARTLGRGLQRRCDALESSSKCQVSLGASGCGTVAFPGFQRPLPCGR
jgi:hypothetical protein